MLDSQPEEGGVGLTQSQILVKTTGRLGQNPNFSRKSEMGRSPNQSHEETASSIIYHNSQVPAMTSFLQSADGLQDQAFLPPEKST